MQEVFRYERLGLAPDGTIIGRFNATGVRSHYAERFRQCDGDVGANGEFRHSEQWHQRQQGNNGQVLEQKHG